MRSHCYAYAILLILSLFAAPARCEDLTENIFPLPLPTDNSQQTVSGQLARPISKIAENITIITADQIAILNAHSLAEVLETVPGIHMDNARAPGSWTAFSIQGGFDTSGHILLLIDGISQGNLSQGANDPGLFPVQHIERIEIIKGSASAAWGAALGGVINIVTKAPDLNNSYSGTASASFGEHNTTDLLADISGTSGDFGYYLFGDNLYSKGLLPNNGITRNNLYGKLTYSLPVKGVLTLGSSYVEAKRGLVEVEEPTYIEHDNANDKRFYSFLNLTYPIRHDLLLELTGLHSDTKSQAIFGEVINDAVVPYAHYVVKEKNDGGKVKLTWGDKELNLTSGFDYLHSSITQTDVLDPVTGVYTDKIRDSYSIYANSTISFDKLTLLPGIRYDKTGLDENTTNYTLGSTYQLANKTLVRGYAAKGYSLPFATINAPQKIWTFQAGVESEALPYVWLKGTLFYNHIWDIQENDLKKKRDVQGFELEANSSPIRGFSLSGGYTYTDTRDSATHKKIKDIPTNLVKFALKYNNASWGTKGVLTGNYVNLNSDEAHLAHYSAVICNLHLTQKLLPHKDLSPEVFFNLDNMFNGSQYWDYWYKNTPRWIEGGVRFSF